MKYFVLVLERLICISGKDTERESGGVTDSDDDSDGLVNEMKAVRARETADNDQQPDKSK